MQTQLGLSYHEICQMNSCSFLFLVSLFFIFASANDSPTIWQKITLALTR